MEQLARGGRVARNNSSRHRRPRGRGIPTERGGASVSAEASHQGEERGLEGSAAQRRGRGHFRGTPGGRRPGGQRGRSFTRQPRHDTSAGFGDTERNLRSEPVSRGSHTNDRGSRDGRDNSRTSRPSWEEDVRPCFPVCSDRRPADRAVPFPSFDDVMAAGKCRRDNIGPASRNAASRHVYDCFLNALSSGARATLSSFRLVPDSGLGRLVEAVSCNLASLYGKAVAFCDPDKEYICYGKILKLGKELVALLYDGVGVTSEGENHEFVLVNLNVDAFCFIHFLAVINVKSSDDLSRVESLLLRQEHQRLDADPVDECGRGSLLNALDLQAYGKLDGRVSLDSSQAAALQATGISDIGVLIHAPSGTGSKVLLKAAVNLLLNMGPTMKDHGPVMVANHKSAVTKNKAKNIFDLDAEVVITTAGVEESASAVVSRGKLNESLDRLGEVLQEICTMKSVILHQSRLEGVTREFSMKRHEERNCVEPWLFFGINNNEMKATVSRADIEAFRKDCQNVLKAFGNVPSSSSSVGFSFERVRQSSSTGAQATSDDLKSVYVWKTINAAGTEPIRTQATNIMQLDRCHRWQLYKQWLLNLKQNAIQRLEDAQNEVLKCQLGINALLTESVVGPPASDISVILTSMSAAVMHCSVIESLQPKVLILYKAHEVPAFLAPIFLCGSVTKVVLIGDNTCPQSFPASSLWSFAFSNRSFRLHELSVQRCQSQAVCDLLAPFTSAPLRSGGTVETINGVTESVQFFDTADQDEAILMTSRLCLHLQTHGYEARDVAVIYLASSASGANQTLANKLQQLKCTYRVTTIQALYPKRPKVLVLLVGAGSLGTDLAAALSRARCAVYAFGKLRNADESCQNVFNIALEKNQRARPALSLTCARHPSNIIRVESGSDFRTKFQPNGACMNPCEARKPCGHRCMHRCHDGDHPAYCDQPCLRKVCKRNHLCRNRCSERCTERCLEVFTAKLPNCGHDASFRCYMWDGAEDVLHAFTAGQHGGSAVHQFKCRKTVTVKRLCGHSVQVPCFEKQAMAASSEPELDRLGPCQETMQVTLACGHTASTVCCRAAGYRCTVPIVLMRACGHSYKVACGSPDRRLVPPCNELVPTGLKCGHIVQRPCRQPVAPACTTVVRGILPCGHSADIVCGDRYSTPLCSVTVSKTLSCGHVQIRPCYDDRSPCSKSCGYMLPCRHPCNLRCGNHPHPERCEACKDKCVVS